MDAYVDVGKFDDWLCKWTVARMEKPHREAKLAYTIDLVNAGGLNRHDYVVGNVVRAYCIWWKTDI